MNEPTLSVRRPVGAVLSVRVSSELAARLAEEASRRGVHLSDVVRAALEAHLAPYWTFSSAGAFSVEYHGLVGTSEFEA